MYKRRDLNLKEKYEVLKAYDCLPKCSQREAAVKLNISQTTLCNLLKKREEILQKISNNENYFRKRKRDGKSSYVEEALLKWFHNAKLSGVQISRALLMVKAQHFAEQLEENFVPTDGWLTRWRDRNNVVYGKAHKEKKDAIHRTSSIFMNEVLPEILKQYNPSEIYTISVTGLYYKALPEHFFMFKCGSLDERNKIKQQITILLAYNQDGSDKKTPLIIGSKKAPRSFEGVKSLPGNYLHSENAKLTSKILTEYLSKWDTELNNRKIALLLDNCKVCETDLNLKNIKLVFLPSNTNSFTHPLGREIIKTFKFHYRKNIVQKIALESVSSKSINLLNSFHLINKAWESVSDITIKNCFLRFGIVQGEQEDVNKVNALESVEKISDASFSDYVAIDESLETSDFQESGIDGIDGKEVACENSDTDSDSEVEDLPSAAETQRALSIIKRTLELKANSPSCYQEFYKLEETVEKLLMNDK